MTKADVFAGWRRRDHVMDLHVALRNNDAVNEELDQLAALGKSGVREARAHPLAERLTAGHDLRDRLVLIQLRLQLLPLPR